MQDVLLGIGFVPSETVTLALIVPLEQLQQNLVKRGRSEDQVVDFVAERSLDYRARLKRQADIQCFNNTDACFEAAVEFLNKRSATSPNHAHSLAQSKAHRLRF